MRNATPTPTPAPRQHGHGPGHNHAHSHAHGHLTPEIAAPAVAREDVFSLIALSSLSRLALAAPPVAALWLLTLWAMQNG